MRKCGAKIREHDGRKNDIPDGAQFDDEKPVNFREINGLRGVLRERSHVRYKNAPDSQEAPSNVIKKHEIMIGA